MHLQGAGRQGRARLRGARRWKPAEGRAGGAMLARAAWLLK